MTIIHNSHNFCRAYSAHNITSQENRWLKSTILSWFTEIVTQWKQKTWKLSGTSTVHKTALFRQRANNFYMSFSSTFSSAVRLRHLLAVLLCRFFHLVENKQITHTKTKPQARWHLYTCIAKLVRLPKRPWGGEESKLRIAISSSCHVLNSWSWNTHNPRCVSGGSASSPTEDPEFN